MHVGATRVTRRDPDAVAEVLDLVDAAVYADVFDSAVSFSALHRFGRIRIEPEILASRLTDDPLVREAVERGRSGAFVLPGRSDLAAAYPDRVRRAARLRGRAVRVARVLRHTPFVRGILLTGSVAADDAPADADVDLLVVVAEGRIGTVFVLLGTASRLVGRHWFCPNFYLAESRLPLRPSSVYVGRELGQAEAIVGDADALRDANPWLEEMFPNLGPPEPAPMRVGSGAQRLLETLFGGGVGRAIELRSRRLALSRLRAHYRGEIPEDVVAGLDGGVALRFHAGGIEFGVPALYEARRQALAESLRDG
jgi:predicted nucleotidyltransferase